MALGGGKFISQNKQMPGTYINFVSAARASASLSERGVAAMALELDWGPQGEIFTVTGSDFEKKSTQIFGYGYTDEKLKNLRELFQNITALYTYRLGTGAAKAYCELAKARYSGVRGNDIRITVAENTEDYGNYDVKTYLGNALVDSQTVSDITELNDNDFLIWEREAELFETAGINLAAGSNGVVTAVNHQDFLDKVESCSFNTIGVASEDESLNKLYVSFCKRMRDENGIKFQAVVWNTAADYEGVINVKNTVTDEGASKASLVYWVTGAAAGCAVNASLLNKVYSGEYDVNVNYTQAELENAIKKSEFTIHKAGSSKRVLADINSLQTVSDEKGADFKENQTVRVVDQIANDIASLFNEKYLGSVQNDASGRVSLWNDIVKHHEDLQKIRAIEDFFPDDIIVEAGDTKRSVTVIDKVTPVNAMTQLYMTVYIQ